jgi:hypothetical protein
MLLYSKSDLKVCRYGRAAFKVMRTHLLIPYVDGVRRLRKDSKIWEQICGVSEHHELNIKGRGRVAARSWQRSDAQFASNIKRGSCKERRFVNDDFSFFWHAWQQGAAEKNPTE